MNDGSPSPLDGIGIPTVEPFSSVAAVDWPLDEVTSGVLGVDPLGSVVEEKVRMVDDEPDIPEAPALEKGAPEELLEGNDPPPGTDDELLRDG
jgi:hypothetical protein